MLRLHSHLCLYYLFTLNCSLVHLISIERGKLALSNGVTIEALRHCTRPVYTDSFSAVTKLWVTIRGHSYAAALVEKYK